LHPRRLGAVRAAAAFARRPARRSTLQSARRPARRAALDSASLSAPRPFSPSRLHPPIVRRRHRRSKTPAVGQCP
jgi:hypothetical protein